MFFFHVFIDRSHRINTLLTVYWKYHSSVVVLPLVPTALVAIQQQTHDISQYTVNNIYLSYDSGVTALKMYGELLLNMGPYYHSS